MFRRWRNSHGFGVHSPFGFQLVEQVIKRQSGYAYYAYADIDRCCRRHPSSRATAGEAKMLLRLACMLKIDRAFLPKDAHKAFFLALRSAASGVKFSHNPAKTEICDLVASRKDMIACDKLCSFISHPDRTLLIKDIPDGWCDRVFAAMNEGIMIIGKRNVIVISRRQMQKVSYVMNI